MWMTLAREGAVGKSQDWIRALYEKAMGAASDNDRQAALVYLEDHLSGTTEPFGERVRSPGRARKLASAALEILAPVGRAPALAAMAGSASSAACLIVAAVSGLAR